MGWCVCVCLLCLDEWWVMKVCRYLHYCIEHIIESSGNGDKDVSSNSRDN